MRLLLFIPLTLILFCGSNHDLDSIREENIMSINLTSNAFRHQQSIPSKFTCDGEDISPPLQWTSGPPPTRSYSLICDDPDAPGGTWVHWIMFNIPAEVNEISEDIPGKDTLENGSVQGVNDFGKPGYGGPCPPSGIHHYSFRIYALDTVLDLPSGISKAQLIEAMNDHILAYGELIGTYSRR
jgi:Raf kinase inhibitor-like YbhB/YbcL family protein